MSRETRSKPGPQARGHRRPWAPPLHLRRRPAPGRRDPQGLAAGARAGRTLIGDTRARGAHEPLPCAVASRRPRAGAQALTCSGLVFRSAGGTRSATPPPLSKPTAFSVKTMQRACAAPAPPDLPPHRAPCAPRRAGHTPGHAAPATPPPTPRPRAPCGGGGTQNLRAPYGSKL